jgi:hypothetical protein
MNRTHFATGGTATPGHDYNRPRDTRAWDDRGTHGAEWIADQLAKAGMTGTPAPRGNAKEAPMVIDADYIDITPDHFAGLQNGDVLARWFGPSITVKPVSLALILTAGVVLALILGA